MKNATASETEIDTPATLPDQSARRTPGNFLRRTLSSGTGLFIILAFSTALILLLDDLASQLLNLPHAPTSAAPLLLIGVASLGFQALLRPKPLDLFKALLVSLAFIFWGIDQMLPAGWFTTTLGDVVIVLYVIDLGWMMASTLRVSARTR